MNVLLTSCGVINEELKNKFYSIISKDRIGNIKVLYITTASDGEDGDKSWMDVEYNTILDLGIKKENIIEYKIGNEINLDDYDIIYMMGGNTFYLLDTIHKYNFDKDIISFLEKGKLYIGSSAGSVIMGKSIETSLGYDENSVDMKDFTGLRFVDGLVIPHSGRKEDFINELKNKTSDKLYTLYDGDGILINIK